MISLSWTTEMIRTAFNKAQSLGAINNSILKGSGNFAGFLGEEVVANYIGADIISNDVGSDKYNHDLLYNGYRIEVKTQRRSVVPQSHYEVNFNVISSHQHPDIYAFVSIQGKQIIQRKPTVYKGIASITLCGFISHNRF